MRYFAMLALIWRAVVAAPAGAAAGCPDWTTIYLPAQPRVAPDNGACERDELPSRSWDAAAAST